MCDNLVGYGAVYRICFSLAVFYGLFALFMLNTSTTKDIRVKFHNGFWFLKLVLIISIMIGVFHIPRHTEFGRLLMYVGLTAGFIFIMIQILFVIDFAHSWSFSWGERMESGDSNFWRFALVFSTVLVYSIAITMAIFYYLYFTDLQDFSKCRGNMFLITFNVFHCLLASIISVLPRVQDTCPGSGLLQSSIVSLYTMYLTWCTLSSEPDSSCNPMGDVILEYDKISGVNGQAIFDCVLMFALLIFACNVRTNTSKLEKIGFSLSKYPSQEDLNYFDKNSAEKYIGEELVDGEKMELEYNYSFFHFVMFLASLQLMMVVTNWHSPDELADMKKLVKNWATVWIQLSSSFLCVVIYIWATVTPLLIRTWGPCLGLDYEQVPTEDDYERLRRRRDMLRERKVEDFKTVKRKKDGKIPKEMREQDSNRIETNFANTTKEGCLSKNYIAANDFNNSEETREQLASSFFKNDSEQVEQITRDSGLCDTTNYTTQSRAASRESTRDNINKSTTNERFEELETVETENERPDENQQANKDYESIPLECERKFVASRKSVFNETVLDSNEPSSPWSRPRSAELRMNNCTPAEKQTRPYSSMGFTNKTSTKNTQISRKKHPNTKKILPPRSNSSMARTKATDDSYDSAEYNLSKHKKSLPPRPYSSMTRSNTTGDSHDLEHDVSKLRAMSCEPTAMQKNTFSRQKKERKNNLEETTENIETTRTEQYLQKSNTTNKTDNDKQQIPENKLSNREEHGHSPAQLSGKNESVSHTNDLANVRSTGSPVLQNQTEENKDSESTNTRLRDIPSENITLVSLKMKDHLNWVKSLRRAREKTISVNKQDNQQDKERNIDDKYEETEQEIVTEKTDEEIKEKNENEINSKCQTELQTPDVAKEILRLQTKILKFQAKVVKTQQMIYQMQNEENL